MSKRTRDIPDDEDVSDTQIKRRSVGRMCLVSLLVEAEEDLRRETERFYVRHDVDLQGMPEEEFKLNFRLDNYADFQRLLIALQIPAIICENGTLATPEFGLAVVLRRLSFPNRWFDDMKLLGRDRSQLSRIYNRTIDFIWDTHGHLLSTLNQPVLSYERLQTYCAAVSTASKRCFGIP